MNMSSLETTYGTKLEKYYKYHSGIYDATRWSFLFGRRRLLTKLPDLPPGPRILEVGCGTGNNIELLEYLFPDSEIYGVDLSKEMLQKAKLKTRGSKQVTLLNTPYGSEDLDFEPFDLILLSYSLAMTGDKTEAVLQQVHEDLKIDGAVAVVDFHNSPFGWFQRWMGRNHVKMNGQLLALLKKCFTTEAASVSNAYLGLWQYFTFVGRPR